MDKEITDMSSKLRAKEGAMKKVAMTGSHGTGKSTVVYKEACRLKMEHSDKEVGVLLENARLCPLPVNKESTIESQLWIFSNQMVREIELSKTYDILVCDRTLVDVVAYSYVFGFTELADRLIPICESYVNTYDKIIFKTIKNNNYWYKCGIRDTTDAKYRQEVEDTLLHIYDGLKYIGGTFEFIID